MSKGISARSVVTVSFLVDVLDVVTNLAVAIITGSAVIFGEMAQGIADSIGSAFLVIGERRAARQSNAKHPLGYASEAFFWGLLSAISMLLVGAGLSAWRGLQQLLHPEPIHTPILAIAVLVLAVLTNGYAVSLSARKLVSENGGVRGMLENFSEPLIKGALLRDAIGTLTSVVGLIALLVYSLTGFLVLDALGALTAALCMAIGSIFLISQARELIAGRSLPSHVVDDLQDAILGDPNVDAVNKLAAIYVGATEVLIDADLDLAERLNTTKIEDLLDVLEVRVRTVLPQITRVRVILNSPK